MDIDELALKNAVIGFTIPSGGKWPSPLAAGKYAVTAVEKEVFTTYETKLSTFKPEAVMASEIEDSLILWEFKSKSFKKPQADKLRNSNAKELQGQGFTIAGVTREATTDAVFASKTGNVETLSSRLSSASFDFPVLEFNSNSVSLFSGSFNSAFLQQQLMHKIDFDPDSWPHHFIPFDHDSSNAVMSQPLLTSLVRLLMSNDSCRLQDIVSDADQFWDFRGKSNQSRIMKRADEVISTAEVEELSPFIIRTSKKPVFERRSKRVWSTQALDALSDAITSFCQRQQDGTGYRTGQLRLFYGNQGLPDR